MHWPLPKPSGFRAPTALDVARAVNLFAFFLIATVYSTVGWQQLPHARFRPRCRRARANPNRQVMTISAIAVVIFLLLFFFKDHPTAIGFVIGAFCSLSAGYIGMRIAVMANVRTTQAATDSPPCGAEGIAFNGGAVTGLLVVGLALLAVAIFFTVARKDRRARRGECRSLVGLALGASLISVFARLGGGIYTKAADVGADLVGKIETTSKKTIRATPRPSRTTSETTSAIARAWRRTYLKPTPSA